MNKQVTQWLITHNNPKMGLEEYLNGWAKHCKYVNGQVEAGKNETVHIQAFIWLKERKRLTALKKIDPIAHFEPVKWDNGASEYCLKTETRLEGPIEIGEKPMLRQSGKDWKKVKQLAKENRLDEIPEDIYCKYYSQLRQIAKDHCIIPKRTFPKKCYWYWGKPGTGKTRKACEEDHYKKKVNKWWDGYAGDKRVVIDDIGAKRGECIIDDLKLWADPWNNQGGETKGGYIALTFDELVVTSNYRLSEIASGVDLEALERRFEIHHFDQLK